MGRETNKITQRYGTRARGLVPRTKTETCLLSAPWLHQPKRCVPTLPLFTSSAANASRRLRTAVGVPESLG